jgi:hypothetical protein
MRVSLQAFVPAHWTIPENPFLGPGMAGLSDFVNARFTLPPQPAGIGAFVPATFSLPPQPAGIGDLAPTAALYPIPLNSVMQALQSGGNPANWGSEGVTFNPAQFSYGLGQLSEFSQANPILARRAPFAYFGNQMRSAPAVSSFNPGGPMASSFNPGGPAQGLGDCGCGCGGHGGCGGLGQAGTDFSSFLSNISSGQWSPAWTSFMSWMSDPAFGTSIPVWGVVGGTVLVWALFFSGGSHSRYQRGKKAASAAKRAYA